MSFRIYVISKCMLFVIIKSLLIIHLKIIKYLFVSFNYQF